MHFGAYLEICDLQLSRYKEINNNNNKPKNNPSNWILYSKIHTCSQRSQHPWERKFVRSITISVQEVLLSSASVHYAGLPSPGQLSPAEGFLGTQMAAGLLFMVHSVPPSFHVRLPSRAWGTACALLLFQTDRHQRHLLLSRALQDPRRNSVMPPQINMQK